MITLNQTHSKKFHCTYLLHYYPFDTQVRQRKDLGSEYNVTGHQHIAEVSVHEIIDISQQQNKHLGLHGASAVGTVF